MNKEIGIFQESPHREQLAMLCRNLINLYVSFFIIKHADALPLGDQVILLPEDPRVSHGKTIFVLPEFDSDAPERFREIEINRAGFSYGPPLLGVS